MAEWWRIYYEDESTFSSDDGSPFEAPRTGVQVIAYRDGDGVSLLSQADYYYYEPERADGGWWHCSPEGMTLHLIRARRPLIVFGSMIKLDKFTEIEVRAIKDIGPLKKKWRRGMDKQDSGEVNSD